MHIGRTLVSGDAETTTVWSPWMPRQADVATFTYERVVFDTIGGGTASFTVKVFTKESDDISSTGTEDTSDSFSQIGSTEFFSATFTGLNDLFRFQFTLDAATIITYRFLEPTWFDVAEA